MPVLVAAYDCEGTVGDGEECGWGCAEKDGCCCGGGDSHECCIVADFDRECLTDECDWRQGGNDEDLKLD